MGLLSWRDLCQQLLGDDLGPLLLGGRALPQPMEEPILWGLAERTALGNRIAPLVQKLRGDIASTCHRPDDPLLHRGLLGAVQEVRLETCLDSSLRKQDTDEGGRE